MTLTAQDKIVNQRMFANYPDLALCSPTCQTCYGLGYVGNNITDIYHPLFGKLQTCPNRDLLTAGSMRNTGIEWDEVGKLNWEGTLQTKSIKLLQEAVENIFTRGYGWLFIWGAPGLGKTLALKIATVTALRKGIPARYTRFTKVLTNLRTAFDTKHGNHEAEQRLKAWERTPVLALDEMEKERQTDFGEDMKYELLETRHHYALMEKSITFFASNESPDEVESAALRSRFNDGRCNIVEVKGIDVRPGLEWEK